MDLNFLVEETLLLVERPIADQGVTVSIGAAVSQGGEPGAHEFIRRADAALYRAKEGGRDRVVVWEASAADEEPRRPGSTP